MAEDRVICYCNNVTCEDIKKAVQDGAKTLEAVQEATGAATICGRCKQAVKEVVDSAL